MDFTKKNCFSSSYGLCVNTHAVLATVLYRMIRNGVSDLIVHEIPNVFAEFSRVSRMCVAEL